MIVKKIINKLLIYSILIFFGVLLLMPFLWMASTSLKVPGTEFYYPPQWIPNPINFDNYIEAITRGGFGRSYLNSIIVAVMTVVPTVILTSMAAFAFVKLKFKGHNVLFFLVLMLIMIPQEVTLVPNLLLMKELHWIDKLVSVIVPNIFGSTAVFTLFIIRQSLLTVPDALIESAKIDGANPPRVFVSIILPLLRSSVAAVVIFSFMNSWNDFIYPLVYLNSPEKYTLTLSIAMFQQAYGMTDWTVWMAAAMVSVLPILIVYLFAQKQFIDSMALSGIK